jgi:hypothetical protein
MDREAVVTRSMKVDPEQLEREYIYDAGTPPISFTDLAKHHGVARNTVAERGIKGGWFAKRKAFRESLGMKVTEAMGEEWVALEAAVRERLMTSGLNYLAQWEKKLAEGELPITTKDALGVAAMLRGLTKDGINGAVNPEGEIRTIDPDSERHLPPDEYRRALDAIRELEAGSNDPVDAPDAEASGAEGTRPN